MRNYGAFWVLSDKCGRRALNTLGSSITKKGVCICGWNRETRRPMQSRLYILRKGYTSIGESLLEQKKTTGASPWLFGGFLLLCRVRGFLTVLFKDFLQFFTRIRKLRIHSLFRHFFQFLENSTVQQYFPADSSNNPAKTTLHWSSSSSMIAAINSKGFFTASFLILPHIPT